MSIASRTAGLLGYVEERRRAECGAMLEGARAQAAAILKEAHSAARGRVRAGLEEERRGARAALASAQARLQTRRRAAGHERTRALLALGRTRLADALRRRWADPGSRNLWIGEQVSAALRALPKGGWEIHHCPSWPQEERRLLDERLAREGLRAPRYVADETIAGGIRICAADSVLDGTLAAILADAPAVEGRLLHLLEGETA